MLMPEVLPDEFARGYLGRLRAINGFGGPVETVRALRRYLGEQDSYRRESPVARLVAKALRMPMEVFTRQHTMLPYKRAVTNRLPELMHGEFGSENIIRIFGMSSPQFGVYFCRSCVNEDIDYWGYAYFRRGHQLPGIPCCDKHREPLFWVADKRAFDHSPYELLLLPSQGWGRFPPSISEHSAIDRYLAISTHWLNAEKPIPTHRLLTVLHKRADSLGIRRGRYGKGKLLVDLALEVFPECWLDSIFPGVLNRTSSGFKALNAVMHSCDSSLRIESYAVAMALLFDTAAEALNEIDHSVSSPAVTRLASIEEMLS